MNDMDNAQRAKAIQYAKDKYCAGSDDDIEVDNSDSGPTLSESEDGAWVQAWLWVPVSVYENKENT